MTTPLAAEAIDPIRGLGSVIDDDVALKPYAEVLVEGMTPPPGLQFVSRSAFVDEESVPAVLGILAEVGTSEGTPVIGVRGLGGAAARVPADATAYAHRRAELMFLTISAGPPPVVEAARPASSGDLGSAAPHIGGAYANFLSRATEDEVAAIYPAATLERLREVKRTYDPGNLFASNHNVRPDGA